MFGSIRVHNESAFSVEFERALNPQQVEEETGYFRYFQKEIFEGFPTKTILYSATPRTHSLPHANPRIHQPEKRRKSGEKLFLVENLTFQRNDLPNFAGGENTSDVSMASQSAAGFQSI